jgi:Ca2+-binding RTX toxin-like protein
MVKIRYGTNGNDRFKADPVAEIFMGFGGVDTVDYSSASLGIVVSLDNKYGDNKPFGRGGAAGDKFSSIENVIGSWFDDWIVGTADANSLHGLGGDDTIAAGAGNDYVNGSNGNDLLSGQDGNDIIYGGGLNDVISGGNGGDWIAGGQREDVLYGGLGSDTFLYSFLYTKEIDEVTKPTVLDLGHDTIHDFSATDRINLYNLKAADIDRLVIKEETFQAPGKGTQVKTVLQVWDGPNNLAEIDLYGVNSGLPSGGQTQINLIGRDSYVLTLADVQNL